MGKYHGGTDLIEKYASEGFENASQFARFLHSIEPKRSIDAWRFAIKDWGGDFQPKAEEYSNPLDAPLERIKTHYDAGKDVYLTYLDSMGQMISISGESHRKMKRAYSDMTGGYTVSDLSREFNMPELWLGEYVRAHKWKHSMIPFTDEEIVTKDRKDLLSELVFSEKQKLLVDIDKAKWDNIEKDALKYRELRATLLDEFVSNINKITVAKNPKKIKMPKGNPYAVVISPTDLHYGKGGWVDEVGVHFDMEEARSRLLNRTQNLIDRLPSEPEKVILATGSDWFHIDNDGGTTTAGTAQDMSGTPAQILMNGCELAKEHIEMLRKVAPVDIVFMSGNHDRFAALALALYLEAAYQNVDDVNVLVSPKSRQYVTWGNNLLGFTHGDFVKSLDLPLIMANEERNLWGKCSNRMWFHGHKHYTHMMEKGGCFVIQLPSLAGHDRWHYRKGFVTERAGLFAHLVDKKDGIIGTLYAPVMKHG